MLKLLKLSQINRFDESVALCLGKILGRLCCVENVFFKFQANLSSQQLKKWMKHVTFLPDKTNGKNRSTLSKFIVKQNDIFPVFEPFIFAVHHMPTKG